ncbi:MAG TPA: caspase family protein [Acidobacteriaceae bacterium]|nr:caspase family protein [Acidobacteriaceae bacterium]
MVVYGRLVFRAASLAIAIAVATPIFKAQGTSAAALPPPESPQPLQIWDTSKVPPDLIKSCDAPAFRPPKQPPDVVFESLLAHKRYRLVIGPGFFGVNSPDNRDFIEPTAAMVDAALDARGFQPLPDPEMSSLTGDTKKHYLSGKTATEENIRSALILLSTLMNSDPNNHAIIYFVGHGAISPSHLDVTLSVADQPVNDHDGLRFSDLVGLLTIRTYQTTSALSIPNYIVVLDTCFSGNAALGASAQVVEQYGVQSIQEVEHIPHPEQIAILSSTQAGSNSEAFGLKDTNVSAFGYFFARSIQEDWNCTDSETRDGIITLTEIKDYVSPKLQEAKGMGYLAADMKPYLPRADDLKFMDYDPNRTTEDGFARHIMAVNFAPRKSGDLATVQVANGMIFTCATINGCTLPIASDPGQTFKVSATALTSGQLIKLNSLTGGQAGSFTAAATLIEGLDLTLGETGLTPALGREVSLKNVSAGKTKTSSGVVLSVNK